MASAFENRLRRTIEMAGTDGQTGQVPVMASPSGPGIAVSAKDGAGRNVLLAVSNQAIHHLPLITGARAKAGPHLTHDVDGSPAGINDLGRVWRGKTHELPDYGANRVQNDMLDLNYDNGTVGWVAGTNCTISKLTDVGPSGKKNVFRISRSVSGSAGVIATFRSKTYEPGKRVFSLFPRSSSSLQFTIRIYNNTGAAVLATNTFTAPAQFDPDKLAFVAGLIANRTNLYKLEIMVSGAGAFDFDVCDMQWEDIHGSTTDVPNQFVDPATVYEAGVAGVRYFHWRDAYESTGDGFCKRKTPTLIQAHKIKGYKVHPSWTNRFFYSDDFSNAAWTKTGLQFGAAADSVAFGPGTMTRIEQDGTTGLHGISQPYQATPGDNRAITHWYPYLPGDWDEWEIGTIDKSGVTRSANITLSKQKVNSYVGAPDPVKVHFIAPGLLSDVGFVGFGISSKTGGTTPSAFLRMASGGSNSFAGTAGKGMWIGRASFATVDHMMTPISVVAGAAIAGTGTSTNAIPFSTAIPVSDFTFVYDLTIFDDDDNPCRSAWSSGLYWVDPSRVIDDSVTPARTRADVRGGTARRPGAFGGATVEGYTDPETGQFVSGLMKHVADWYSGRSGKNANTGLWQEIFSVVMADVQFKAGTTVRIYLSVSPSDTGNGSNLLMRVADVNGVFDVNAHAKIESLPAGQILRLGYNAQAGSAVSEQAFKNVRIIGYGMTQAEMAQDLLDNPLNAPLTF